MLTDLNIPALTMFAKTSFKNQLAYRIANLSGLFTNIFFLFIRTGVFIACFENKETVAGLTMLDTLTYLTLTQSFFTLMPHLGQMGLSQHIITGQIIIELNRPINFFYMFMGKRIGIFFYYVLFRFFPIMIIAGLAGYVRLPQSIFDMPLFFLSVFMGFWIAITIMFLIESTAFWFESDRGLKVCMYGVTAFFSGLLIPLNYFPAWALSITKLLPFAYTFNAPTQIYLGLQSQEELFYNLLGQIIWIIVLTFSCMKILKIGSNKVVIHGG
jgi:ABC-2 type transport system permease protein